MLKFQVVAIVILVCSAANGMESLYKSQESIPIAPTSHETMKNSNTAVYLGYANNPFGPSIRCQNHENRESPPRNINRLQDEQVNIQPPEFIMYKGRSKRSVVNLVNMVSCATGCDPLIYKGYGCYCGFLGSGEAVDGIDRCCVMHDQCYDTSHCPIFLLDYVVPYYWTCFNNRPICAIEGDRNSCARSLCECDKRLSECLSRYPCPSSRKVCRTSSLRFLQNAFMTLTLD